LDETFPAQRPHTSGRVRDEERAGGRGGQRERRRERGRVGGGGGGEREREIERDRHICM
jgi:hypothetical protein